MLTRNVLYASDDITCTLCNGIVVSDSYNCEKICSLSGIVTGEHQDMSFSETDLSALSSNSTSNNDPTSLMMYDIGLPSIINSKNIDANGKHIHDPGIEKLRK